MKVFEQGKQRMYLFKLIQVSALSTTAKLEKEKQKEGWKRKEKIARLFCLEFFVFF